MNSDRVSELPFIDSQERGLPLELIQKDKAIPTKTTTRAVQVMQSMHNVMMRHASKRWSKGIVCSRLSMAGMEVPILAFH